MEKARLPALGSRRNKLLPGKLRSGEKYTKKNGGRY